MQKGKPTGKYSQAGRLHAVIRTLESRRGITLDELAEECGVDRRTVHRDLNAVQEAGYPLTSEWVAGKKTYSFITRSRNMPPLTFTLNELLSLYLLRSLGIYLKGTPFQADIEKLFCKISTVLPDRLAAHLERISRVSLPLLQGGRDYSALAEQVDGLRRALLYQYRVRIAYAKKGKGEAEEYDLDPYTLIFHKGGIYLLGYAHNRRDTRMFALERIQRVDVSRHRFEIPEGYEPEAQFRQSFGLVSDRMMKVRIRFAEEIAHTVRDQTWHPGQTVLDDDQGGIILEFEAGGELEIVSWILSYGRHAEVLDPPELRREVKRHVREMREFYRGKDKKSGKAHSSEKK